MSTPRRPEVVALRAAGLGDLLTVVPALRALADEFGAANVAVAAPSRLRSLVGLIDPALRVAAVDRLQRLPAWIDGPSVAVNLHGRGPQSHRVLLATRPGRLVAFANDAVDHPQQLPSWVDDEHEVLRWSRLLNESGVRCDPTRLALGAPPPLPDALEPVIGATIIHPGAGSASRRWPLARWIDVAHHELACGRPVVVTGDRDEAHLAGALCRAVGLPSSANLSDRTSPLLLASVVAGADLVLSGDTGVAHLATALGTRSITLFGPVSPARWGPLIDPDRHAALWAGLLGDPHGDHVDEGLLRIEVDDVLREVDRLTASAAFRAVG